MNGNMLYVNVSGLLVWLLPLPQALEKHINITLVSKPTHVFCLFCKGAVCSFMWYVCVLYHVVLCFCLKYKLEHRKQTRNHDLKVMSHKRK